MHNHLGKNPKIPQNTQNLLRNRVLLAKKCWVLNQNWHGQGFCDKENKSDIKIKKRSSTWQLWRHNHLGKTLKIPKNIRNWLFNRLLLAKKWWFLNENLYGQGFWGKENKSDIKIQNNKVFDSYNFIITWGKTPKIPQNAQNWLLNRLLLARKWWVLNQNWCGTVFWGNKNDGDIKI